MTMLKQAALGLGLAIALAAPAAAQSPIKVSYQPALYWSAPYFIATEKGWWKEVGLTPEFSTFAAGAPQVAAAAAKSWDVGGVGSAPAVLGAQRFNILTIGITNDESAGNAVVARKKDIDKLKANPASLKGQQLLLTTNSTGEYAALACLGKWGLKRDDMQLVNLGQAQIISAFSSGNGMLAGVWAPNIYTLEEKADAAVICSGKDVGVAVPGTLIVRADYAKENPDKVAAYLAVYLRSIAWQKANRAETIQLMKKFYEQGGVTLPEKYLAVEIDTRPTFTLDEQLKILDRSGGASTADQWYAKLGEYLKSTGTLSDVPDTKTFITDEYMKRVAADAKLRDFANAK
jgi:ABC-type nitrate/sulfonate/bicarbonate transport system substrate-binding protein